MTVPLSAQSPRREIARRFGIELREAMAERGIGTKTLAPQVPCATSAIANWRSGCNLPTLKTALKLSEALQWPKLYRIAQDARQGVCPQCGTLFVNEGGKPKLYCSPTCRTAAEARRAKAWRPDPDVVLARRIDELAREAGTVRKRDLRDATATFRATRNRGVRITLARDLDRHRATVERFCRSCEWDGFCKNAECELRPISPLPLEPRLELPDAAQPAQGAWGPDNREAMLAAVRATNAERWSRPGERERASESSRAWHAGLTPAERIAWKRKIGEANKGRASYRACGCPNRAHRRDCPTRHHVQAYRQLSGGGL